MQKLILYIAILLIFGVVNSAALDETTPVVTLTTDGCGNYKVNITELALGDVGIDTLPILKPSKCYNVSNIKLSSNFKLGQANYDFYFTFFVLNPLDSASFQFFIPDMQGNANGRIITYTPKMQLLLESFNFLASIIDDTTFNTFKIKNNSQTTEIVDMKFRRGLYYQLLGPKKITLSPNEELNLIIGYCPKTDNPLDMDTLDIVINCNNIHYKIILSGYGVKPQIKVEDVDFGFVRIGEIIKLSNIRNTDSAITISNPGTSFLNLSKYKLLSGKYFKISTPPDPELEGFTVYPKDSVHFKSIELFAGIPGAICDTLVISSNAKGPDSIAILTAYAVYPGAYLSEYNFGDLRLFESDSGFVYIMNSSEEPIDIEGISVTGDTNDIKVRYSEITPLLKKDEVITLYPEEADSTIYCNKIKIPIHFKPLTEYSKRIKIALKFAGDDTSSTEIFNYASGRGIIPKVYAEGHDFQPEILAGTKYQGVRYLKVTNTSTTSDMILYKIESLKTGVFGENFFLFPEPLPINDTIAKGETLNIPIEFYPMTGGNMTSYVKITTNANPYNSPEYTKDTIVRLTGSAYRTPVITEHTKLPKVNKCSKALLTVKMTNINSMEMIKIDSIKISAAEKGVFEFADNSIKKGFDIAPAGVYVFDIIYNPSLSNNTLDRVIIDYFCLEHSYGFEIFAESFSSNVSITLDKIYNIRPGVKLNSNSGNANKYKVNISSQDFVGTKADSFDLQLLYNPAHIQFVDEIFADSGMELWTLTTKTHTIKPDESILSIIGHSPTPISKFEGNLYPAFEIMLSDANEVVIQALDLRINDNSTCFSTDFGIGKIFLNICTIQMGKIISSQYGFNLVTITPNPVTTDFITIKFSVAFRALTRIDFFNASGNLIYSPLNTYLEPNDYEMQFSVKDVPAGTYLVKFTSGFFTNSQQIIIIK
jgi:hypothetical protein